MSRELIRSFVVYPKDTSAEERIRIGSANRTTTAADFGVEEDGGFLFKLRRAAGVPVRFLGRALFFAPVILVVKLVMGAIDHRASDILVPIFATIVTLFFASVCLWILLSFIWWVARGRHAKRALIAGEADTDLEAFEGTAAELSPGSSVLFCGGAHPDVHYAQMEAFALLRDGDGPIIVAPSRMPRAIGVTEPGSVDLVPSEAASLFVDGSPDVVVVRPGDRVRVRGVRIGDVPNAESFTLDGAPAALVTKAADGAYRAAASIPAIIVGDGPTRRLVIEKLEPVLPGAS